MTSSLKGKKGCRSESICTHRKVLLDNDEKNYREKKQREGHAGGLESFKQLKDGTEKEKEWNKRSKQSELIQKMIISC